MINNVYPTEESSDKKILDRLNDILQHPDSYTQKVATSVDYYVRDVRISITPISEGIQVYFNSRELQRAGGSSGGGITPYLYLTENTISPLLRSILNKVREGFIKFLGMPEPGEDKHVSDNVFDVWKQATGHF